MQIQRAVLTHVRVPLVEPFRISSGVVAEKDAIVVSLEADGVWGYGESSPMSGSFYSADTPESCWNELRQSLIPSILGVALGDRQAASEAVNGLRGSNFAKVGVETALWDLAAKREGQSLAGVLGGTRPAVESGLAVGLYEDPINMLRAIERYLVDGYKRVKIKIEQGRDIDLVRSVRQAFGDIPLFVDANGGYDPSHTGVFQRLDEFGLMMLEQPFPAEMLPELAELQSRLHTPVCLDESLDAEEDLRQAIALGSLRIANLKIQRVGGLSRSLKFVEICRLNKIPVWVGTMPELGIGCAQAIALASLSDCCFPTDVEASSRWFLDDIIEPWIEVRKGLITVPDSPGIGFTVRQEKVEKYAVATQHFEV